MRFFAARNVEALAGDIARFFRREEGDRVGSIFGEAGSPHRDLGDHVGHILIERTPGLGREIVILPRAKPGRDMVGTNVVDGDVVRAKFDRRRADEPDEAVLRRAIGLCEHFQILKDRIEGREQS